MEKDNKIQFIIMCSVLFILIIIFVIFLIGVLSIKYPNKEDLKYEECTFIKYEFIENRSVKSSSKHYNIYVEEYDKELRIDNIIYDDINKELLDKLKKGDKIIISVRENNEIYDIYSMSYKNNYILSYEAYLNGHYKNDKIGLIVIPIFIFITGGLLLFGIIYYKKTSKCFPF